MSLILWCTQYHFCIELPIDVQSKNKFKMVVPKNSFTGCFPCIIFKVLRLNTQNPQYCLFFSEQHPTTDLHVYCMFLSQFLNSHIINHTWKQTHASFTDTANHDLILILPSQSFCTWKQICVYLCLSFSITPHWCWVR